MIFDLDYNTTIKKMLSNWIWIVSINRYFNGIHKKKSESAYFVECSEQKGLFSTGITISSFLLMMHPNHSVYHFIGSQLYSHMCGVYSYNTVYNTYIQARTPASTTYVQTNFTTEQKNYNAKTVLNAAKHTFFSSLLSLDKQKQK